MSRKTTLLLILWNLVLTGLVAWGLLRGPATPAAQDPIDDAGEVAEMAPVITRDTGALKESRIAYFRMDSLSNRCDLFKDKNAQLASTARNLEAKLQREQDAARKRYEELVSKDRTYSTQAELEKDDAEMQERMKQLQDMQADAEERIARLENETLRDVSEEVNDYLKLYNASAGFDFIFSIQGNGQIWVGNEGLNITDELVAGLNARYKAGRAGNK